MDREAGWHFEKPARKHIELQAELIAMPTAWLLAKSPELELVQVFRRSINLIADDGQFVTVATRGLDPGPFSVLVENDKKPNLSFEQQLPGEERAWCIAADTNGLHIGRLHISLTDARVWNPTLVQGLLCGASIDFATSQLAAALHRLATRDSLPSQFIEAGSSAAGTRINEGWLKIKQAIDDSSPELCRDGSALTAGVGIGLTPAGDDFLMGVILAMWLGMTAPSQLIDSLIEGAEGRTGRLSLALIRAAGRGEASQPWHALVDAIVEEDSAATLAAARAVLGIGHTSGADALFGFMVGLEKTAGKTQEKAHSNLELKKESANDFGNRGSRQDWPGSDQCAD